MMNTTEAALAVLRGFGGPSGWKRADDIERTLVWVRANCEAEGLDPDVTAHVLSGIADMLFNGTAPVLPEPTQPAAM